MPCSYFKVILEIYFKINNCGPCFQSHPAAGGTCGCCLLSILVNPVPPTSVLLAFGGCKWRWTITPPLCKLLLHLCLNSDNCKGKKSCALGGKTDWEAACSSFLSAAVIKHCDQDNLWAKITCIWSHGSRDIKSPWYEGTAASSRHDGRSRKLRVHMQTRNTGSKLQGV